MVDNYAVCWTCQERGDGPGSYSAEWAERHIREHDGHEVAYTIRGESNVPMAG